MLYNKKYLSKRPFLLIFQTSKPAKGANTSQPGWAELNGGQWSTFESIKFDDRVKDKDMVRASVIIDIMEAKVVKNSFREVPADQVMKHYLEKYKAETTQAVALWLDQKAAERAAAGLPELEMPEYHAKPDIPPAVLQDVVNKVIEKTGGKPKQVNKEVHEAAEIVEHDIHVAEKHEKAE